MAIKRWRRDGTQIEKIHTIPEHSERLKELNELCKKDRAVLEATYHERGGKLVAKQFVIKGKEHKNG